MKKTISICILVILCISLSVTDSFAQTRIKFKKGASSATVKGTIGVNRGVAGANYRHYVIRAGAGQTISARVTGGNGKVVFVNNDRTSYKTNTGSGGDFEISIYNGGANNASFTLTVSIR